MEQDEQEQCPHGFIFKEVPLKAPKLVAKSSELSRPGYSNIKANQYEDAPEALKVKVKELAAMIKKSENCVVYTGAGISRASGIADYASKAKKTKAGQENPSLNRLQAQPTDAHHVLVAMQKKGFVKHWLQQNHDGLAQKAGFPQSKLNEIHGSWFDKKNTVVLMDDCLKPANHAMLEQWEGKVDLCLALGTSLCGMRSDGIAQKAAKRGGLAIINLQRTPYDPIAGVRLYGNLQAIVQQLGQELGIKVTKKVCMQNPSEWNK